MKASLPSEVEEIEAESDYADEALEFVELERADEGGPTESSSLASEGGTAGRKDGVGNGSIFELSDGFDDDQETDFDEGLDFQDEGLDPEPPGTGNSESETTGQELDDLNLDLDDLNLDDIEFDNFGDEPELDNGLADKVERRPTQIDNEGELDDFLKQDDVFPPEAVTAKDEESHPKDSVRKEPLSSQECQKSPKKVNTKRNFMLVFSCFLVLSLALWAGYGLWQRFSVDMKKHLKLVEVENQRLRLPSDRIVIVLRGKVVNSSPKLVTDLKLKGVLLDAEGQVVAEVVTAGGVSFSEEELDRLDAGKLAMLENGEVTLPANGGELPFMIAFYDYPEKAHECFVEISSFKVKNGRRPK